MNFGLEPLLVSWRFLAAGLVVTLLLSGVSLLIGLVVGTAVGILRTYAGWWANAVLSFMSTGLLDPGACDPCLDLLRVPAAHRLPISCPTPRALASVASRGVCSKSGGLTSSAGQCAPVSFSVSPSFRSFAPSFCRRRRSACCLRWGHCGDLGRRRSIAAAIAVPERCASRTCRAGELSVRITRSR